MSLYCERVMRGVTAGVTTVALVLQPQMLVAAEVTAVAASVPSQVVATTQSVQSPSDIVLQDDGALVGRIVDAQGLAVANTPVSVQTGGKEVARVLTDETGRFRVAELKGGVYQVASTGHQGVYRLWAPRTAPPAAAKGLSIVSQPTDVVRGQYGPPPGPGSPFARVGQWVAEHPIITAGVVAAAIAIPLVLNDDDDPVTPPATP